MILAPTMQQRQEKEAELFCLAFQRVSMLPNKGRFSYQILSCRELCKNSTSLLPSIFELFFLSLSKLRQCVLCRGGPGWSANGKNKFNRWITFNRVLSQRLMLTLGQQLQKYPNNHSISIELIIIFFCSLSTACKASQNHVVLLLRTSKIWSLGMCQQMLKILLNNVTYATTKTKRIASLRQEYMFPCDPKYQFCSTCRHQHHFFLGEAAYDDWLCQASAL